MNREVNFERRIIFRKLILVLTCWLAICGVLSAVRAQTPDDSLGYAAVAYASGYFQTCINIATGVLNSPASSLDQKCEACTYKGASYYRKGKQALGEQTFERCIHLNPEYRAPLNIGQDLQTTYNKLRDQLLIHLIIMSNPSEAIIYLNGRKLGNTPLTGQLVWADSSYHLEIVEQCFVSVDTMIRIGRGDRTPLHFDLQRKLCPVRILCDPSDAIALIFDSEGRTILLTDSIPCGGVFKAKLSKDGYRDTTITLACRLEEGIDTLVLLSELGSDGVIKYVTAIGVILAVGAYTYFEQESRDSYDRYMESVDRGDISRNWNKYEKGFLARRVSAGAVAGLGALSIYLWSRYIWGNATSRYANIENPSGDRQGVRLTIDPRNRQVMIVAGIKF